MILDNEFLDELSVWDEAIKINRSILRVVNGRIVHKEMEEE